MGLITGLKKTAIMVVSAGGLVYTIQNGIIHPLNSATSSGPVYDWLVLYANVTRRKWIEMEVKQELALLFTTRNML